ncbi:ABC-type Fe3+ transport system, periplasmic component [Basidiobolus meristosporus CBS 931.73]|uniref:ABC-type Fe3+ transport system, periplasmic component n=1 Tax=Basidiobolus meristosporus CBS 931.73 TaxID=1314790 RepID=A0A1Y1Y0N7_9FUNG|nr:ABC-type Fe3+ transport system, periplasmic component [Basidiobolus meristosporus CBS 931.73]|eukprot:ORX91286.1 ABC-type Fe3+ transport system, periplasmic component [Basidiobolus meristosporus CBS 931.73]
MLRNSAIALLAAATLLSAAVVSSSAEGTNSTSLPPPYVEKEEAELQRLYQAALKEGGLVNVFAGGDRKNAMAHMVTAFETKFPGTKLNITVDLSKYHDALIDKQLARGGDALEPDVAHLQTLHDFPKWKAQGALLQYKPVGFDHIHDPFKDPEGYYWATSIYFFTNMISKSVPEDQRPIEAADYLASGLQNGKIMYTYPNDDDAVLYQFMRLIQQNGLEWFKGFLAQKPWVVRGTNTPGFYVRNATVLSSFTTMGNLRPSANWTAITVVPKTTFFQSWSQFGAIFTHAKHPAAAKLYVSWLTSYNVQKNLMTASWSQRTDVPLPPGMRPIWETPNTDPIGFRDYMMNRTKVAEDKAFIEKWVGPVQGVSPLDLTYS